MDRGVKRPAPPVVVCKLDRMVHEGGKDTTEMGRGGEGLCALQPHKFSAQPLLLSGSRVSLSLKNKVV